MPDQTGSGERSARRGERSDGLDDDARATDGQHWGGTATAPGGASLAEGNGADDEAMAKDAAEQEALARDLGEELTDIFVRYVRGEVEFADLTFLTYDLLHDLHIVASGAYELEYDEDEDEDDEDTNGDLDDAYEESQGTEQQEELAQEPAGP